MREFVVRTYREFSRDGGSRLAAALAYYALFATAPALLVAAALAGALLGQASVSAVLKDSLVGFLGRSLADTLIGFAESRSAASYYDTAWVGVGALVVTSALALNQVQIAFNRMWLVDLRPGVPILHVVRARLSQAVIVLLPAALLVAATMSSSLATVVAARPLFGRLVGLVQTVGSPLVMLASASAAFLVVFKYLPDVYVPWRPAAVSAAASAVAWLAATYLLRLYVARSAAVSVYGAAGSVFVLLIWLNYSARVLLLGCKVSKILTERSEGGVAPRAHATRVWYQAVEESDSEVIRLPGD